MPKSYISPLESGCLTAFDDIMYSIILHKIFVIEIDRQLAADDFSPFLNICKTLVELVPDSAPDSSEC